METVEKVLKPAPLDQLVVQSDIPRAGVLEDVLWEGIFSLGLLRLCEGGTLLFLFGR